MILPSDPVSTARPRNLGGAIVLAAIQDYRSLDDKAHKDAERFLYPKTPKLQRHYDWAVALAGGVNPVWCEMRWTHKARWKWQRFDKVVRARRQRAAGKGEKHESK